MTGIIKIRSVEYYQPECKCKGSGHICYLRPVPKVINIPIEKIIKATSGVRIKQ